MNRDVLLVYLKNLRDLEVAKYQLVVNHQKTNSQYSREINSLTNEIETNQTAHYEVVPDSPVGRYLGSAVCLIMCILLLVGAYADPSGASLAFFLIMFFIILSIALFPWSYREKKNEVIAYNEEEKERLASVPASVAKQQLIVQSKKLSLAAYNASISAEHTKVCQLLEKAYSLNILPSQYRNLASIYYIYDYMSTSQASLKETLMHEHMENGIQRILERLDTIIAQNEERILIARRTEANTRETADNTRRMLAAQQQMLESMERTEQNTAEAARVAQVAAGYSEINAFFSTAEYLDRQRGR